MKIFYTIRARIGILFTLLILIVMAGLAIFLSNFVRQSSLEDLEIRLEHEALLVGSLIEPLISRACRYRADRCQIEGNRRAHRCTGDDNCRKWRRVRRSLGRPEPDGEPRKPPRDHPGWIERDGERNPLQRYAGL